MIWRCPICRRPTDSATDADFPFCGPRCRLLDLGHWAAEDYRVRESTTAGSESQPACGRQALDPHHDDSSDNS